MVEFLTLNGSIRKDLGSSNTNRLRKEGYTPAVIYGTNGSDNLYISIAKKDFDKEYLKGNIEIKPIELTVDGKKYQVLTYQIDIDPLTDLPRHVDFINIKDKKEVKVYVPVNFIGKEKAPGLKRGGFLNILKRKIQLYVDPMNIPASIDVYVDSMHIGSKIKINDVKLPDNVKVVDKTNFNVVTVTGRGKSTDDTVQQAAATTDATATATTDAAATTEAKK